MRKAENRHDELIGGSFTLTNIGSIGGTSFAPIVNHPEVTNLGLARAALQPVVQGDPSNYRITPRLLLSLCLAFDHRSIDGAEAARFMSRLRERLSTTDEFLATC